MWAWTAAVSYTTLIPAFIGTGTLDKLDQTDSDSLIERAAGQDYDKFTDQSSPVTSGRESETTIIDENSVSYTYTTDFVVVEIDAGNVGSYPGTAIGDYVIDWSGGTSKPDDGLSYSATWYTPKTDDDYDPITWDELSNAVSFYGEADEDAAL